MRGCFDPQVFMATADTSDSSDAPPDSDSGDDAPPETAPTAIANRDGQADPAANDLGIGEPESPGKLQEFTAAVELRPLKTLVKRLERVVDTRCRFHVDSTGLSVTALGPEKVVLFDGGLGRSAFNRYDAGEGLFGVRIADLHKVLKRGSRGDLVQLELLDQDRQMEVVINGLTYRFDLEDPKGIESAPTIPEQDWTTTFTLPGRELYEAFRALDVVMSKDNRDYLAFEADPAVDAVEVRAVSSSDHDAVRTFDELTSAVAFETIESDEALYGRDKARLALWKCIHKGEQTTVRFGTDTPMVVSQPLADGDGTSRLMQSPRKRNE